MTPVLVFDIETIPDIAGLRTLHELPAALPDAEVAEFAFQRQRARNGSDFLPLHLQRVVVISCALRNNEGFRVWSLAEPKSGEGEIIQRFFDGVEKLTPQIVSWNGGGFDLPVLHYRGLVHGVVAPRYWDLGDGGYGDSGPFRDGVRRLGLHFAVGIQLFEDAAVFAQDIVDVAHEISRVAIEAVVVGATALVGAEALVRPPDDRFAAFHAGFFLHKLWKGYG